MPDIHGPLYLQDLSFPSQMPYPCGIRWAPDFIMHFAP